MIIFKEFKSAKWNITKGVLNYYYKVCCIGKWEPLCKTNILIGFKLY